MIINKILIPAIKIVGDKYDKEYLIKELEKYYNKYNRTPNASEYIEFITSSRAVLYKYFDSYYQLLMKADVPMDNIDESNYKYTMPEFCSYCALKDDCEFNYNF